MKWKMETRYEPSPQLVNKLMATFGHRVEICKIKERLSIYSLAISNPYGYHWIRNAENKRMLSACSYFLPANSHDKSLSEIFRDEPAFISEISRNSSLYEITPKLRFSSRERNEAAMHCKVFSERRMAYTEFACQHAAFVTVPMLVSYSKKSKAITGVLGVRFRLHYASRKTVIDDELVSRLSNESNHLRSKVDHWVARSIFNT